MSIELLKPKSHKPQDTTTTLISYFINCPLQGQKQALADKTAVLRSTQEPQEVAAKVTNCACGELTEDCAFPNCDYLNK